MGRTTIQLALDDWSLEKLMTFDAEAAELELEPDDEEDGPPVVLEVARPKVVGAGGPYLWRQAGSTEPHGT